jgi:uncharacterized protein
MENQIKKLGLIHLDHESGLLKEEVVSRLLVRSSDGISPASSCIYYALTREFPQNHLHWLMPDDYHILIDGGPADYFLFLPDGNVDKRTLGRNIEGGEQLIVTAPAGAYKALQLHPGSDFVLVGSVITPAWKPERVRFGAGQKFIDRYSGKADWATASFLKELIGPNWKEH